MLSRQVRKRRAKLTWLTRPQLAIVRMCCQNLFTAGADGLREAQLHRLQQLTCEACAQVDLLHALVQAGLVEDEAAAGAVPQRLRLRCWLPRFSRVPACTDTRAS